MKYQYRCINDYTENDYKSFYNFLTKNDKLKVTKIIDDKKKKQVMLGRMMLKEYLNDINIDYSNIKYNKYGKPYIDNIYFNISHACDYVIFGTNDKEIGVDIERIRPINLKIMNQFCTDNERAYILSSKNQELAFWTIYTLKEAYFKMYGIDLSLIKNIEFKIVNNKVVCLNDQNLNIYISNEIHNYIFSIIYR